jgi:hypothetical protein
MAYFTLPQDQDKWIMHTFSSVGFSHKECDRINSVRLHQHVLHVSDIFNAYGVNLDLLYLYPQQTGKCWSQYRFGIQNPPPRDFALWRDALNQLAPGGRKVNRLGKFIHPSHMLWPWQYTSQEERLYCVTLTKTLVYSKLDRGWNTRLSQSGAVGTSTQDMARLPLGTAKDHGNNTVSLQSFTSPLRTLASQGTSTISSKPEPTQVYGKI